ncbi:MAG TPA: SgcJ/EcaC family oxidoreductase [Pseudonocardia sp.]|uniref:YybH family protein n=1 Tax=Pseudonocardia sp. TaxID=60912 RepID=UPI002BFCDD67|nr:SgcJ/EcaC family oxidoreductase [Pseudonocardia sp.]HTF51240.1 SgcJ/EcaC family oxidoreductase [Pseudonocardia sp.]
MATRDEFVAYVHSVYAAIARAVEQKDADGFVQLYTPDAALMTPDGSIISGRDAIRDAFVRFTAAGWVKQEAELVELSVGEDLAVGQERTQGTFLVDGEKTVARNNCLIVYTRQGDGRWLMHRDIWNTISDTAGSGNY